MIYPRLEDVRPYWIEDVNELLDIRVAETALDDWRLAVEAIRKTGWRLTYSQGGEERFEERSMPNDVEDVLARAPSVLWRIWPSERLSINCHFLEGEIEFDASPRELEVQTDLDALCEFITTLGRALQKPVLVIGEGESRSATPALRYDPTADAVSAPFSPDN